MKKFKNKEVIKGYVDEHSLQSGRVCLYRDDENIGEYYNAKLIVYKDWVPDRIIKSLEIGLENTVDCLNNCTDERGKFLLKEEIKELEEVIELLNGE